VRLRRSLLPVAAEIVTAVSGLCLVLTIQMRWVSKGLGSTLDGYNLAAALRRPPARGHPWAFEAAMGIYGVAAIGCVLVMIAFARNHITRIMRGLLAFLPAAVLAMLSIGGAVPMGVWSSGAVVTFLASTFSAAASAVVVLTVSPREQQ
jgi:hypothetical protein